MKRFIDRGFTLIELLIVVAIIAILAAIAVPNFLEAQTRAKVSRAKADMRSLATGLETYQIDNNTFVYQNVNQRAIAVAPVNTPTLERLTTPVAYLNAITSFKSPFTAKSYVNGAALSNSANFGATQAERDAAQLYWYNARNSGRPDGDGAAIWGRGDPKPTWYYTHTAGPFGVAFQSSGALNAMTANSVGEQTIALSAVYDSTNGTTSRGGIFRVGGTPTALGKAFYNALQGQN